MSYRDRLFDRVLTGDVFSITTPRFTTLLNEPKWMKIAVTSASDKAMCIFKFSYFVGKLAHEDLPPINIFGAAQVYSVSNRPDLGVNLENLSTIKLESNKLVTVQRNSLRFRQSTVQVHARLGTNPIIGYDPGYRDLIPLGRWREIDLPPQLIPPNQIFAVNLEVPALCEAIWRMEWWEE